MKKYSQSFHFIVDKLLEAEDAEGAVYDINKELGLSQSRLTRLVKDFFRKKINQIKDTNKQETEAEKLVKQYYPNMAVANKQDVIKRIANNILAKESPSLSSISSKMNYILRTFKRLPSVMKSDIDELQEAFENYQKKPSPDAEKILNDLKEHLFRRWDLGQWITAKKEAAEKGKKRKMWDISIEEFEDGNEYVLEINRGEIARSKRIPTKKTGTANFRLESNLINLVDKAAAAGYTE